MILSEFDFEVQWVAGRYHTNADTVSRLTQVPAEREEIDEEEDLDRMTPPMRVAALQTKGHKVGSMVWYQREVHREREHRRQQLTQALEAQLPESAPEPEPRQTVCTVEQREEWETLGAEGRQLNRKILQEYAGEGLSVKDVQEAQEGDMECRWILDSVRHGGTGDHMRGETHPDVTWAFMSKAVREMQFYKEHKGLLYRVEPSNPPRWRIYVPRQLREAYMSAFHERMGHPGERRMTEAMKLWCFWPGMYGDCKEHVQGCVQCARATRGSHGPPGERPRIGSYPMEEIVVDVLELPKSRQGYCRLLIFIDSLSRWVEARAFKREPNAIQVVDTFVELILCRHGTPRRVRCDLGGALVAELTREVYAICDTQLETSTAGTKNLQAVVERVNDTVASMIRTADPGGKDWCTHLPYVLWALRATPHSITKVSPAFLLYGRELRPIRGGIMVARTAPSTLQEYARLQVKRMRAAWLAAGRVSEEARKMDKMDMDMHRRGHRTYQPGDRVMVRRMQPHLEKTEARWEGPCRVWPIGFLPPPYVHTMYHASMVGSHLRQGTAHAT